MNLVGLYRSIFRLHRKLPAGIAVNLEFRNLGNKYLKSEFRLHQSCAPEKIPAFTKGWIEYKDTLENQLNQKLKGVPLSKSQVDTLSSDQIGPCC